MLTNEAFHRAVSGNRKAVSLACDVGLTLVGNWTAIPKNAGGPGDKSPVQRTIEIVLTLKQAGDEARATELISYVARECGGTFVPLAADANPASLGVTAHMVKEFGEMLTEAATSLHDGHMNAAEAEKVLRATEDVLALLIPFARACQGVIVDAETAEERERKGPHASASKLSTLRTNALRSSVA